MKPSPLILSLLCVLLVVGTDHAHSESPSEVTDTRSEQESTTAIKKSCLTYDPSNPSLAFEVQAQFEKLPFPLTREESLALLGITEADAAFSQEDVRKRAAPLHDEARTMSLRLWLVEQGKKKLQKTLDVECQDKGGYAFTTTGGAAGGSHTSVKVRAWVRACCKDHMRERRDTSFPKGAAFEKYLRPIEPSKLGFTLQSDIIVTER